MTILPGQTATVVNLSAIFKNKEEVAFLFSRSVRDDWHVACVFSIENQNIGLLLWCSSSSRGRGSRQCCGGRRKACVFRARAPTWAARLAWASVQVFFLTVQFKCSYFCFSMKLSPL